MRSAAALLALIALPAVAAPAGLSGPLPWADVPGFAADDHVAALKTFVASCTPPSDAKAKRTALAPPSGFAAACAKARALARHASEAGARRFFESTFDLRRVGAPGAAFFTGYYEPVVDGALARSDAFPVPLYAPPASLVTRSRAQNLDGIDPALNAARRQPDGTLVPLPDRAAVDAGALAGLATPLVYVRDPTEAFFVQIQGSARIRLPDGKMRRLVFAARNGYPYTSIGKILVQTLNIPPEQMGLAELKAWIREHGQGPEDAGTRLMQQNRSYIFFAFDPSLKANAGPIGGSGVSLTPLRSLAIDRTAWPYGLPFYVDADLPWRSEAATPFQRVMIGQDTGAAIIGQARGDVFFGSGPEAARFAGPTRHSGTLYVLWPKEAGRP